MDCSPPGSSVHGILQARILEWAAMSSSRGSSQLRDWTCSSYNGRQILYYWATWEALDENKRSYLFCVFLSFKCILKIHWWKENVFKNQNDTKEGQNLPTSQRHRHFCLLGASESREKQQVGVKNPRKLLRFEGWVEWVGRGERKTTLGRRHRDLP